MADRHRVKTHHSPVLIFLKDQRGACNTLENKGRNSAGQTLPVVPGHTLLNTEDKKVSFFRLAFKTSQKPQPSGSQNQTLNLFCCKMCLAAYAGIPEYKAVLKL